jgi:two-component sensor histidine kinase
VPPLLVELAIGGLMAGVAVGLRVLLTPLLGDTAPFVFVFAAVAIAAIAGGWRSGLIAMLVGQALTLLAVLGPAGTYFFADYQQSAGFLVATVSQLILLVTIALYQREVDKGTAEHEQRLALLDEALREIDHRTRNNYQTVLAMIALQSSRETNEEVQAALRQVTDRIQAIANASEHLAVRSGGIGSVRLDDHLCELVGDIGRGLSRKGIAVDCKVDDVMASADAATSISIIVNELVTNAIKHAFNGVASGSVLVTGKAGKAFELTIADDGRGIEATRRDDRVGLGTKLVDSFARQLGARHEVVSTEKGTTHRLVIPQLD